MSLFDDAMEEMRTEVIKELEDRIWQRIEPRIQQELHARYMSLKEAAKYLHVSDQTVRRMITSNELPSFRVRQQIFLRQVDIDAWVEQQISCR